MIEVFRISFFRVFQERSFFLRIKDGSYPSFSGELDGNVRGVPGEFVTGGRE